MQSPKGNGGDISVGAILAVVRRRFVFIVSIVAISFSIGAVSLLLLRPTYMASIGILLDPKGPDASEAGGEFVSRTVDSVKVGSVVSVIQSNQLLDRVVVAEHLTEDPEFSPHPSLLSRFLGAIGIESATDEPSEAAKIAKASEVLHKMMTVTRDGFTYVIKIDVVSGDPAKAKRLAQAIGDTYLNDQLEAKYESARRNFKWLSERLEQMKGDVIASEDAVQKIQRQYGLTQNEQGENFTVAAQEINELNKQLIATQTDVMQKQARAELAASLQASGGDLESLPEVSASASVTLLKQNLAQAVDKLTAVSQRFGARHPEAIRAANDVAFAKMAVGEEIKRVVVNLQNDYKASVFRSNALQVQATKLSSGEGKGAAGLGRLHEAQRVAEANRRLYDNYLNRFKEVEHSEGTAEVEARIISPPRLPTEANFPKPMPVLLGGLGFGVIAGLGLAFLFENLERTFTTPAQVEDFLQLPVLASVPLVTIGDLSQSGKPMSLLEYTAMHPVSLYADSLRGIRLALQESTSPRKARIVNFASPMPNEGKSTLAACVAMSAAMAGTRTILIDCDLRHASASRAFHCQDRRGLVDILVGQTGLEDVLVATEASCLSIIPAGRHFSGPPDLVNSERLRQVIQTAAEMADLVILDSAAIELVSDALVLSQVADETVMVVKWNGSDRALALRAVDRLHRAQAKLTGIVLNSVDLTEAAKYGYWSKSYIKDMQAYYPQEDVGDKAA